MARPPLRTMLTGGLLLASAAACAPTGADEASEPPPPPVHAGIETRLLDADLVNFRATMTGGATLADLDAYSRCAAVQYTLIRGYGYARHVRTNISEEGGVWTADAVYTISPELPLGTRTLEAAVVAADCAEQGIPSV